MVKPQGSSQQTTMIFGTSGMMPRDQTLALEESKFNDTTALHDGGNVSSSDFLAGLGIAAMNRTAPIGRNSV